MRETFFTLLKPYFSKIDDFINKRVQSNEAIFDSYFLKKEFLEYFGSLTDQHLKFAEALLKSSQFVHFCDDYFAGTGQLNNFQMFKAILVARGEL